MVMTALTIAVLKGKDSGIEGEAAPPQLPPDLAPRIVMRRGNALYFGMSARWQLAARRPIGQFCAHE
jgi:hypothetical protein